MAKDEISSIKSQIKELDIGTAPMDYDEATSRGMALKRLKELKELEKRKLQAGMVLKRIPIPNGYKEVWV